MAVSIIDGRLAWWPPHASSVKVKVKPQTTIFAAPNSCLLHLMALKGGVSGEPELG